MRSFRSQTFSSSIQTATENLNFSRFLFLNFWISNVWFYFSPNCIKRLMYAKEIAGLTTKINTCIFMLWGFSLRNRKHVPCFYRVIQTGVEVWENEKCCGNTSRRQAFPQLFRVLPNFHECLYNSIETPSTCFLFLLENNAMRKKKTNC